MTYSGFKSKLKALLIGFITGCALSAWGGLYLYKNFKDEIKSALHLKGPGQPDGDLVQQAPPKDTATFQGYKVFVASSLDRIFKDGRTLVPPQFTSAATIASATNEYESFQIVVQNGDTDIQSITIDTTDLTPESQGQTIAKSQISIRTVGYIPTKKPYYPVKYIGLWPDPLMPFDIQGLTTNTTQPFWVTIYVPPETTAGNYSGTIRVTINNDPSITIPVSLRVYNFEIPKSRSLKTAFDFYGHETPKRYPQGEKEGDETYQARIAYINDKFILEMLKMRMDPVLNVDPSNPAELSLVDRYRFHGLTNFSIGKRGGTLNNNWPRNEESLEELLPQYRMYGEMLALHKMLDYHYIYTWDEGPIGEPIVQKVTSMIHRAHPKLKNLVCYHGFWDPDVHPGWGDDIDIWVFQISKFNEAMAQKLIDRGIEIWMYISGPSGDGAPNLGMDFDSIDYRITPWMSYRYNWKGFLYWCVNWWALADPFETAANTKWEQNGNGLLFYPGENGPITSLRAEIWRDGMEDYEYFIILKNLIKQLEGTSLKNTHADIYTQAQSLLDFKKDIVISSQQFTRDNQQLIERRDAIAEMIETIQSIIINKGQI